MKKIGIICEYSPFHNGHLYHLKKIKELFNDSLIILVLNGYFLQRGEISILSKKDKTEIALSMGIDLIIELPFIFGSQSADIFANTSIKILENLKCDYVVFGSESNNINALNKIANYMITKKDDYDLLVKDYLDKGENYPTACAKALKIDFKFKSNDLLGISYIKSIIQNNYNIIPYSIQRTNDYLDTSSNDNIISASNIREKLKNKQSIENYVPKEVIKYINDFDDSKLFNYLKYKIITDNNLNSYLDVEEGIENRLKKVINNCHSLNELIENVKSKRYTYNKIKRMLMHILLSYTKDENKQAQLDYIKILGFNSKGKKYLNEIKNTIKIPLTIQKDSITYQYEIKCAQIYDLIFDTKENVSFETKNKPLTK